MKYIQSFDAVNEAKLSTVHRAAKKGSYPAVIVVVQDGKVIHQEPVSTPDVAPATFNVMQEKYPKALLHLEDKTGKRLFSESVSAAYNNLEKIFGTDQESMDMFQGIEDKGTVKDMIAFIDEFGNEEMLSRYGIKSTSQVKKLAEFIMGESVVTEAEDTIGGLNKMANTDLERIADYADMIKDRMSQGQTLDAWMYSKISDSVKNLNSVHDTMDGNDGVNEAEDYKYKKYVSKAFNDINDAMFAFRNAMGVKQLGQADKDLKKKLDDMQASIFALQKEMKSKGLTESTVTEAKGGQIMPGDYVKNQHGNIYQRVDGKVGGHDAYVRVTNGKAGKRKTGLHDSFKLTLVNKDGLVESVNEAKFTKRSLMKAMKKDDGMIQLSNGQEYVIYNPNNGNDDNADMWKDKVIFGLDQDGEEHEIEYSDIVRYDESVVNEAMDINDPVLVAYRRTRAIMELPKFKPAEVKSRRISFNKYMDLLDSQSDITIDIANYVEIMAQTLRDMEQEAEPEGGAIADKYGSIMMKQEKEYTKLKAKKAKIDARIEKYKMS